MMGSSGDVTAQSCGDCSLLRVELAGLKCCVLDALGNVVKQIETHQECVSKLIALLIGSPESSLQQWMEGQEGPNDTTTSNSDVGLQASALTVDCVDVTDGMDQSSGSSDDVISGGIMEIAGGGTLEFSETLHPYGLLGQPNNRVVVASSGSNVDGFHGSLKLEPNSPEESDRESGSPCEEVGSNNLVISCDFENPSTSSSSVVEDYGEGDGGGGQNKFTTHPIIAATGSIPVKLESGSGSGGKSRRKSLPCDIPNGILTQVSAASPNIDSSHQILSENADGSEPCSDGVPTQLFSLVTSDRCCRLCSRQFNSKSTALRHVKSVHFKQTQAVCDHCGFVSSRKDVMKRHNRAKHPELCLNDPLAYSPTMAPMAHHIIETMPIESQENF